MNKWLYLTIILSFLALISCSHTQSKEQVRTPAQSDIGNGSIGKEGQILCLFENREIKAKTTFECSGGLKIEGSSIEELERKVNDYGQREGGDVGVSIAWKQCSPISERKNFSIKGKNYEVIKGSVQERHPTIDMLSMAYIQLFQDKKLLKEAYSYNFVPVMSHPIIDSWGFHHPLECTLK